MSMYKKRILVFTIVIFMFLSSIMLVNAKQYSKTYTGAVGTTKYSIKATFDDVGVVRWIIGSVTVLSTGGKGGAAAKSGGTSTSRTDNVYTIKQSVSASSTDANYITTTSKKTFVWNFNDDTKKFQ